jgi:hypothetical protein
MAALFLAAVGCGGAAPRAVPVAEIPRAAPAIVETKPAERGAAPQGCAALRAEGGAERFRCLEETPGGGAWAISVGEEDAVTVVHADAAGKRTSVVLPREPDQALTSTKGEEGATLYDFDGDGVPELFFTLIMQGLDDYVVRRIFLTVEGGSIVPYAPAHGLRIDQLRDVDGDGRPDAVVAVDLGGFKGCDFCASSNLEESFVAHALPNGTFSLTDEVAKRYVRARCPAKPRPPFIRGGEINHETIACARIWGVPRKTLLARLQAECASHAHDAEQCSGPCRYLGMAQAMAALEPPTRLD